MNNQKISNKLELKDLVLIGVYAVIYLVMMFAVGMMGVVPILFLIYPAVAAIICGPLVLLFMAKVPKPMALAIFGLIMPVIMLLGGAHVCCYCRSSDNTCDRGTDPQIGKLPQPKIQHVILRRFFHVDRR